MDKAPMLYRPFHAAPGVMLPLTPATALYGILFQDGRMLVVEPESTTVERTAAACRAISAGAAVYGDHFRNGSNLGAA